MNSILPGGQEHQLDQSFFGSKDVYGVLYESAERLNFSDSEEQIGKEWLKKRGWAAGDKIVAICVRDSAYLDRSLLIPNRSGGWGYHDFRNSDITTFEETIRYLLERKYWVIRMGSIMNEPVDIRDERFIDYPFCNDQNPLLETYLLKESYFVVSTGTGMDGPSDAYRVPAVFVNALPLGDINHWRDQIWAPKKLSWMSTGQQLDLEEYFIYSYQNSQRYRDFKIRIVAMSGGEILDAVKERELQCATNSIIAHPSGQKFWEIAERYLPDNAFRHPLSKPADVFLSKYGQDRWR